MQHPFPAEIGQLVTAQLATGKYSSENEVLLHALRTLQDYNDSVVDMQDGIEIALPVVSRNCVVAVLDPAWVDCVLCSAP
jgi:hypothetical protein